MLILEERRPMMALDTVDIRRQVRVILIDGGPVSYTHLTLPTTIELCGEGGGRGGG